MIIRVNKVLRCAIDLEWQIENEKETKFEPPSTSWKLGGHLLRAVIISHPLAAGAAAVVGAVAASPYFAAKYAGNLVKDNFVQEKDKFVKEKYFEIYTGNYDLKRKALDLLVIVDADNIKTFHPNVLGGLLHLVDSYLKPRFTERLSKIDALLAVQPENAVGASRRDIYGLALDELSSIEKLLHGEFDFQKQVAEKDRERFENEKRRKIEDLKAKLSVATHSQEWLTQERRMEHLHAELAAGIISHADFKYQTEAVKDWKSIMKTRNEEDTQPLIRRIEELEAVKFYPWDSLDAHYNRLTRGGG